MIRQVFMPVPAPMIMQAFTVYACEGHTLSGSPCGSHGGVHVVLPLPSLLVLSDSHVKGLVVAIVYLQTNGKYSLAQ
jgi:hypothetical protein